MNVELVYSWVIDSTWFFLGSWLALLLTAGFVAFGAHLPARSSSLIRRK